MVKKREYCRRRYDKSGARATTAVKRERYYYGLRVVERVEVYEGGDIDGFSLFDGSSGFIR